MARRSYYPQNQVESQQIISKVSATTSSGAISRPVTPATEVGQLESTNGSAFGHKPPRPSGPGQRANVESIPMDGVNVINEKAYAI